MEVGHTIFFGILTAYFEVNAWACFHERFEKIKKGKSDSNERYRNPSALPFTLADTYETLDNNHPVWLQQSSSVNLALPSDSVDFVFTDPPYGDSIQYGELCALWGKWLGLDMHSYMNQIEQDEIIINTHQKKNLAMYQALLTHVFQELFRVLKNGKFMLVTFHNTKFEIRNAIITASMSAGFELKQIIHQMPPRVSVKALLHYRGSPIGDYYIRFQKNPSGIATPLISSQLSNKEIQGKIQGFVRHILNCRGEPTSFLDISNHIDEFLCKEHLFPLPNFDSILKDIIVSGEFFIDNDGKWWFSQPDPDVMEIPLSTRIRKTMMEILNDSNFVRSPINMPKQVLNQRIFNLLYSQYRGIYTPDKKFVNDVLNEIRLK